MRRVLALGVLMSVMVLQALPARAALTDTDGDFVDDAVDLCPAVADSFQGDLDGDGIGDLCEPDTVATGTDGADLMIGTNGADTFSGLGARDALYGSDGDDDLDGGDGNDFLSGGPGTDRLTGGAGCDVFAYDPRADGDIVTDYQPDLDRLLFPPQDENPADDVPPAASFGGDTHLVVTFTTDTTEATLEFEGLPAGTAIALNTSPCAPPPIVVPPPPPPPVLLVCSPIIDEPVFVDLLYLDPGLFPLDGILLSGTAADETLVGTDCSDIIAGDEIPGEDESFEMEGFFVGEFSDDVIDGLAGNDIIFGDSIFVFELAIGGDDEIHGGAGDDAISGDGALLGSCGCDPEDGGGIGGDDTIFGEAGDDTIVGDAFDALFGASQGGNDTIDGGDGDDLLLGDGFMLDEAASGGDDIITGGVGDDEIAGDGIEVFGDAAGGDDMLDGGDGADLIHGDAYEMDDNARGGDDTIVGGEGDDEIAGDGIALIGDASGGNDILDGGEGDDVIYGDAYEMDDTARGADDVITGGPGDDLLFGDSAYSTEFNGYGWDTFVYDGTTEFGDDTIGDLQVSESVDTIRFDGVAGDIAGLDARSTVSDDGLDVLAVVFTDGSKITEIGSILMLGIGDGTVDSWADVHAMFAVEVVVVP